VKLAKINNILVALIIIINAYVLIAPLLPALFFHVDGRAGEQQRLQQIIHHSSPVPTPSQPNHVIIPSMLLDQSVLEGTTSQAYTVLNRGVWRWPHGSTPDKGGNTVLIGHRFTYTKPKGVFYFLNKVKIGDEIGVIWSNKSYLYKVASVSQVPPNDTAIEDNTKNPELTVFTCTPLWAPKDRLVVVADLETKP
jgi:LPXTG-site transpeptidase (sortase) family protein